MAIEVVKPGLATSVQDAGRPGYYKIGIPLSGALDQYALRAANLLVGNEEGAAVLEATLLGPELIFRAAAIVAVTGAEATPKVNGEARPRNESFAVRAGDRLTFDYMKVGARIYIAIAGGIDVPPVLGSRSTYALGALGGFAGRKLAAADVLPVGPARPGARAGRVLAKGLVPAYPKSLELRVLTGLYFDRLTEESAHSFFEDTWTVAPEADRIGYRYRKGRPLSFRERKQPFGAGSDPSNIVDAGYPYGSIQVPGGLEPIILHRDAVSGGGYAMIGTVISADMDRIAQMQPNNLARFVEVDMDAALKARAQYKSQIARLSAS
ncbi:MAG TPA: biotin-dependent carboxyltransferase family protein [Xanthobacteraceae bacterium]|nr:biotin-dependent carboxyltransferase family protein [Xanthobacteraceae bacterium]